MVERWHHFPPFLVKNSLKERQSYLTMNYNTSNYKSKAGFTDFFSKTKKAIWKSSTFARLKVRVYYPQTKKVKYLFEH